jgi:hypothetical protein
MIEDQIIDVAADMAKLNKVVDATEDINDLLKIWGESSAAMKKFVEMDEKIKARIKAYLKERKWERYTDDKSKISVTLSTTKRETFDNELVKKFLTPTELSQVIKVTTFEKMLILTPENRKNMMKFIK